MAWWAWLIIWTVLVLGLLGMLAWLGWRLFKKGAAVFRALEELGDRGAGVRNPTTIIRRSVRMEP